MSKPSKTWSELEFSGEQGLVLSEPLIFEQSRRGRVGYCVAEEEGLPSLSDAVPTELDRGEVAGFPELTELQVARHFTRLSHYNFGVDSGFYPLGSCTMKYNPKVNEYLAGLNGFSGVHPFQDADEVQGVLQLAWELERYLAEIAGFDRVSLQPAAGAHGELLGMLLIRAYHESRGDARTKVLVPDTAHGTNPASCALAGFTAVPLKSGASGVLEVDTVVELLDDKVAAIMITNPNTLGLFERNLPEIARACHDAGALVYGDGANLNAAMGCCKQGALGIDVFHFNLHKTFSTPHGGGGPGAGPVGVKSELTSFLPVPTVERGGDGGFYLDFDRPQSVGAIKMFWGHLLVWVKAYAYIRELGASGLKRASEIAVLNARYIQKRLRRVLELPYSDPCMHECVFSGRNLPNGLHTLDLVKRLMDYGFHPPTVYFPLVVDEALMIEPTETEPPEVVEAFCEAVERVVREASASPELLHDAPHHTYRRRLDEVSAARHPKLRWSG